MQIKTIDFTRDTVELIGIDGMAYKVKSDISVAYYPEFAYQENSFYSGRSPHELFAEIRRILTEYMGKEPNFGMAAHGLYNILNRQAEISDKGHPSWMYIVYMFLDHEGKDYSKYDKQEADKHINNLACYSSLDFFQVAARLVPHFINDFSENMATFFQKIQDHEKLKTTPTKNGGKTSTKKK